MPDFVVDLDCCVTEPDAWDYQIAVAVTARDRDHAAETAMLLAGETEFEADDDTMRKPYRVNWVAVENGTDDGFDYDWREYRPPDTTPNA